MMDFQLEHLNDSLALAIIGGNIDILSAPTMKQQLSQAMRQGVRNVLLNLQEVTLMDHTGIMTLRECLRMFRDSGGELALVGISHQVDMKLRLLRFDAVFPIYADVNKAILRI